MGDFLSRGQLPPLAFNERSAIFHLKEELEEDALDGAVREAIELRPLGSKNTDNKSICGAANEQYKELVYHH